MKDAIAWLATVLLLLGLLAYTLIDSELEHDRDVACVESGHCEWVEDDDGDLVARVKSQDPVP